MGKIIILVFIILNLQSRYAWAGEDNLSPRETPYPEEKYYEKSFKAMDKQRELLESLYMKKTSEASKEMDLKKMESTFFLHGTVGKEEEDFLKEAEQNRWEEWSPFFYEFGKALKEQGKKIYHEWFFPKKSKFEEIKE